MEKKNILITGAASGIGRALSIEYAANGIKLFLLSRSEGKLQELEKLCIAKGAEVEVIVSDVKDNLNMQRIIEKIYDTVYLDIIIACAGISAGTSGEPEKFLQIKEIVDTNLYGVLNTIMPAIPFMMKHRKGDIVILSSMAALMGLARSPAYSASKAAVKLFGDALRPIMKNYAVNVCVVIPGYVDTPMTQSIRYPMPLKISAEKAAKIIIKAVNKKKGVITLSWVIYLGLKLINLLPYQIIDYLNSKLHGRSSLN